MNIQRISSLMHVRVIVAMVVSDQIAVNLNGLSSVSLLSVELTTFSTVTNVDWLNEESSILIVVMIMSVVAVVLSVPLLSDHCLPGRVEPEVGLSHQLLVEGRIHTAILIEILW